MSVLFGWSPRLIQDKVRVAHALEQLPEIAQALKDGAINWTAVRELTRVATKDNEGEWLDATKGLTVRQIERMISGRAEGDGPHAPRRPELKQQLIQAAVQPRTMALWRE